MKPTLEELSQWTDEQLRVKCAELRGTANRWVIMKRGLYYRPDAKGYTSRIEDAWIVSEEEADKRVYPHDEPVTKHRAPSPNYPGDRNACAEFDPKETDDCWQDYICTLMDLLGDEKRKWPFLYACFRASKATPKEKTIAYVFTAWK